MCGGAGLHSDQARRQRRKKLQHLAAAKLLFHNDLLGRIDAMDLKHVLGDIQTDCGNLHVDGSLMWLVATITLRRFVAGSGRRPPHQKRSWVVPMAGYLSDLVGSRFVSWGLRSRSSVWDLR